MLFDELKIRCAALPLICLYILIPHTSRAQNLHANFSFTPKDALCTPVTVAFTDSSTGNVVSWKWNFGDGGMSTSGNPSHTYTTAGRFLVYLAVFGSGGARDTVYKEIVISTVIPRFSLQWIDTCSPLRTTIRYINTSTVDSAVSYEWSYSDRAFSTETSPVQSYTNNGVVTVTLKASSSRGCSQTILRSVTINNIAKPVLPSSGAASKLANRECQDLDGWINYYNDNNTPQNTTDDILLLSIKPNGNIIGHIGDGTFELKAFSTAGAGSNTGVLLTNPLITNSSGYWVMNRYWTVQPTRQPESTVGVRFYFNTQDINDVNGSFPSHNLTVNDLLFYKTVGGNPDPTSNLQGASRIISIVNASTPDTTHWAYTRLVNNTHMAEFQVSSFSGGGGGATGNGQTLPIRLTSFHATRKNAQIELSWSAAEESGIKSYEIEKSYDGVEFSFAGSVKANLSTAYSWADKNVTGYKNRRFYRLKMVESNGSFHFSSIASVLVDPQEQMLGITPNPARYFITVTSKSVSNEKVEVLIFDNLGKKVLETRLFNGLNEKVNITALKNGTYHVILKNGSGQTYTQSLIISK